MNQKINPQPKTKTPTWNP